MQSKNSVIEPAAERAQCIIVKTQITAAAGREIVLTAEMLCAAGILPGHTLTVSIQSGEIRITRKQAEEPIRATIVQKGKIKVLYGGRIPDVPVEQAVRMARDEMRSQ
jgi:hypothetical protein